MQQCEKHLTITMGECSQCVIERLESRVAELKARELSCQLALHMTQRVLHGIGEFTLKNDAVVTEVDFNELEVVINQALSMSM